MRTVLSQKQFGGNMLKHFVFFALFCPFFTSSVDLAYSPDFMLLNVFALGFVAAALVQKNIRWSKQNYLVNTMLLLLVCFNLCSCYVNWVQLGWYMGQINVTIVFLFFVALISRKEVPAEEENEILPLLLKMILISNAIGLVPYFLHYYGFSVMNGEFRLIPVQGEFDERRYNWLYTHKSEYAFMMILFLSLVVKRRKRFPEAWMYWASLVVLGIGLLISNTRTSMVAALFIFVGLLADFVVKQPKQTKKRYLLGFIPLVLVGAVMLYIFSQRRSLTTLGGRTYIWAEGIKYIRENPYGLGVLSGDLSFPLPDWPGKAHNCHNVFLNILMQFSIPAGFFYILMMVTAFIGSWRKNVSFLTAGIWIALLIPLNMDWCLLLTEMPTLVLVMYFLFFSPGGRET